MRRTAIIAAAIVVLVIGFAAAYALQPTRRVVTTGQLVTINGSDGQGGIIDPINVSATYQPRGRTVAQVHPGEQVTMIKRDGDGVLIRTRDGTEGWVTYWFINGLKP